MTSVQLVTTYTTSHPQTEVLYYHLWSDCSPDYPDLYGYRFLPVQMVHVQLFIITILLKQIRRCFCLQINRQAIPSPTGPSTSIPACTLGVYPRHMSTSVLSLSACVPLMMTHLSIPDPDCKPHDTVNQHCISSVLHVAHIHKSQFIANHFCKPSGTKGCQVAHHIQPTVFWLRPNS